MKRFWIAVLLVFGAVLFGCALLVPAHFRALDAAVVEAAGRQATGAGAPTVVAAGLNFLSTEKLGPARMLQAAAQAESLPGSDLLGTAVAQFSRDNPSLVALGGASPVLDKVDLGAGAAVAPLPIMEVIAQRPARAGALRMLQSSRRPGVQQTLLNRSLTNTVHFPPATTAAGQPLEAAILLAALLNQGDFFTPTFRDAFEALALRANQGASSGPLELVYLDLLSLGRRFDWVSLAEWMRQMKDPATLGQLAAAVRAHEESTANIYAAVILSAQPLAVAKYLARFPETGLNDLNLALRHGRGAVELLVKQERRLYYAGWRNRVTGYVPFNLMFPRLVQTTVATPIGALVLKYACLVLAALCLARSISMLTATMGIRFGFRFAADWVFALAMTFVVGVAIEPWMGLTAQPNDFPVLFRFPSLAVATGLKTQQIPQPLMNQLTLASLIFFFVVQAAIYVFCLMKLAEIRRQPVPVRMKLKLLENEDLLFDAGLYVGFVGSVLSLILMSLGLGKVSMMAYASTSFGIIFVSVLKIFHVRPLRRQLLLESEAEWMQPDQPVPGPAAAGAFEQGN